MATIQEQNDKLRAMVSELHQSKAEMEADVRTVVEIFGGVIKSLDLNMDDFKGGNADIGAKLPMLLAGITRKVVSGTFDMSSITGITSLSPIMDKYKGLVGDLIEK